MKALLKDLDRLLRGGYTSPEALRSGRIRMPVRQLIIGGLVLGSIYGIFMGLYGATRPGHPSFLQLVATTAKVPLLFMLTLAVTMPSLYVFSALASSRLRFVDTMRLLLAAIAINLSLLASLGPVMGFFTLSTKSYPFMVVLNVVFFSVSGGAGLVFLRRALAVLFEMREAESTPVPAEGDETRPTDESSGTDASAKPRWQPPPPPWEKEEPASEEGAESKPVSEEPVPVRRGLPRDARDPGALVFRMWIVIYGIVGAQMGWILRPFVGSPDLPFELFRERQASFFGGIADAVRQLFS